MLDVLGSLEAWRKANTTSEDENAVNTDQFITLEAFEALKAKYPDGDD